MVLCNGDMHECLLYIVVPNNWQLTFGHLLNCRGLFSCCNLWIMITQLSFGPIGWLMISEIFPLRLRGRGLSIAVLVNFGANAVVTFAFSPLKVLGFSDPFYFYQILDPNLKSQLILDAIYLYKRCCYIDNIFMLFHITWSHSFTVFDFDFRKYLEPEFCSSSLEG